VQSEIGKEFVPVKNIDVAKEMGEKKEHEVLNRLPELRDRHWEKDVHTTSAWAHLLHSSSSLLHMRELSLSTSDIIMHYWTWQVDDGTALICRF
jgi:hypothetical protein